MTSLYGDIPNDIQIQLNDHSDIYSDDGNQQDEIRKALAEGFGDESFDFDSVDSDDSSENESRCSSVNLNNNHKKKTSFLSNKDNSNTSVNVNGSVLGSINGSGSHAMSNNSNGMSNGGVNLNMLPNSIMEISQNMIYPMNMSGKISSSPTLTPVLNGHPKVNGNFINGSNGSGNGLLLQETPIPPRPKKQVTIVENGQKNREEEEIEASNPTISLLHKQHCPRNDNGTPNVDSDMWLASENKDEQAKTMLELRERQIHRAEEEIQKLQKDKRSLNHQIGLMKTEMVHMKSQNEEAEKLTRVKDQECEYLRVKLQETIGEYEKAKGGEIAALDEVSRLNHEIEKFKQEIVLLSDIGRSSQQAEVDEVVRQLREKHEQDYLSYKKVVATLEGELKSYKRKLQLQKEDSFIGTASTSCQTEPVYFKSPSNSPQSKDSHKHKEKTEIAIVKDREDGDLLIKERKIISLNQRFEEMQANFEEEKAQLISSYQHEIDYYRHKLQTLPNELYTMWENTQRELGLQVQLENRPICVDAFTSPDPQEELTLQDDPLNYNRPNGAPPGGELNSLESKSDLQDAEVQVNFASVMANVERRPSEPDQCSNSSNDKLSNVSGTNDKETSHAEIQTEETLETYKILGQLLNSWSQEVQAAKAKQEETAEQCTEYENALKKLQKQFRMLHKIANKCRKESKARDEAYKKQISDLKQHQIEVLKGLEAKLNVLS